MTDEYRRLLIEGIAEMKELKGEMREFKEHFRDRVERLEKRNSERRRDMKSTFSLLVASAALVVSIIINFFRQGVK
jgi:hypothetical protein